MDDKSFTIRVPKRWVRVAMIVGVTALIVAPLAAIAADSFTDVANSNTFHDDIAAIADVGVTKGCNPPVNDEYCPNDNVTRGQMAAFMNRLGALGPGKTPVVNAATAEEADHATDADNATNADDADTLDGLDSTYFQPAEVPLGATIYGTIGALDYTPTTNDEGSANAQLPIPAPVGLDDAHVTVAGGSDDTAGACTGSSAAPTAAPGHVCIYPYSTLNTSSHRGYIWGAGDGTKWGFQVSWIAPSAAKTYFYANWAYTAPNTASGSSAPSSSDDPSGVGGN